MYTADEMEHIINDSGAKVLFVYTTYASKLKTFRAGKDD